MISVEQVAVELQQDYDLDEMIVYRVIDRRIASDILERPISVKEWAVIGEQLDNELDEAMAGLDFWEDQKSAKVKED
jgi:hypothetical protein